MTVEQLVERFVRRWNEGNMDRFLELFAKDVVMLSDETWPENDTVHGHEGLVRFWNDFRAVWDDVQLRVNTLHTGDAVAALDCQWVTRGRASGVEGTIEFAFAAWFDGDQIKRGQFFEEFQDAVHAVGLAP